MFWLLFCCGPLRQPTLPYSSLISPQKSPSLFGRRAGGGKWGVETQNGATSLLDCFNGWQDAEAFDADEFAGLVVADP